MGRLIYLGNAVKFSNCAAAVSHDICRDKSEDRPSTQVPRAGIVTMSEFITASQLSSLSHAEEMQKLGISTEYELRRFKDVQFLAGNEVASREIQRNLAAYEREFLQDEPVGLPHDYYHVNGELYSESIDHPLFNVKKQIDARERDGATLRGFSAYEKQITEASTDNEVFVWYSPAGNGGTQGPFKDLYFDSGRLYLCFKNGQKQSVHLDVKVNEELFPIKELLDHFNYCANGKTSPSGQTRNQAGHYYLESPIQTKMNKEEFLQHLEDFIRAYDPDAVAYVSQRDSHTPTEHTLGDIYKEVSKLMTNYSRKEREEVVQALWYDRNTPLNREDLSKMYIQKIAPYLDQQNGKLTLYGCSTTSTITDRDIFSSSPADILSRLSPESVFSEYSTTSRLLQNNVALFSEPEQEYVYDREGNCQGCGFSHTKVGKLGPCDVCRDCTQKDTRKKKQLEYMQKAGIFGQIYLN